jgi:EAL domain-containing protein (putative c-di-GMP-specific phosphodiesterase class I)
MAITHKAPKGFADRLISALQQEEFVLYAQTIIPVASQRESGLFQEIFVRFKEEDAKLLPPGAFLAVLEESHLLPYLDRWVVNRLARWVRGVALQPGGKKSRSNVNLSGQTLADPHFGEYVRKYVDDSYLSDGALAFEVTCANALEHLESLQRLMAELRPHGCCFTLAGFDGDERCFDLLKTVVPDFVKINVVSVPLDQVAAINSRCHSMGSKTIAEYVESDAALEHLRRIKVDFAQGFGVAPVEPLV